MPLLKSLRLPEELAPFLETLVSSGEYPNVEGYVSDLIRVDQRRREAEGLKARLEKNLVSGSEPWDEADLKNMLEEYDRSGWKE